MDIRLGDLDVPDLHLRSGLQHELHHADVANVAARALVELRFLIALRGEHGGVGRVPPGATASHAAGSAAAGGRGDQPGAGLRGYQPVHFIESGTT